jgi:MOSC domain-containing protein YiiM
MKRRPTMKVVSVNVGLPREVLWKGRKVTTGIFKNPVEGHVQVRKLNLEGDQQADLTVHGGPEKAVYAYPEEHYEFWRRELEGMKLNWATFGENLTLEGVFEGDVNIGDQFRIGSALLSVTQPRVPCYKLGIRFGRDDILKRFLNSGRSGFYFAVLEEGEIRAGDLMELVLRNEKSVSVADVTRLFVDSAGNLDLLQRAVKVEALPAGWRDYFLRRLRPV